MKTVYYTTTATLCAPGAEVIDFNAHQRRQKARERVEAPWNPARDYLEEARRKRRRLETLCLLLEAGVCATVCILALCAAVQFLFL